MYGTQGRIGGYFIWGVVFLQKPLRFAGEGFLFAHGIPWAFFC
jgi:hypothetical protein